MIILATDRIPERSSPRVRLTFYTRTYRYTELLCRLGLYGRVSGRDRATCNQSYAPDPWNFQPVRNKIDN